MIGHPEAECALLGCLMSGSPLLTIGFSRQLEPEDFASAKNRAVLAAIRSLVDGGQPVDPITVLGEMRRSGLESSMSADKSAGVYIAELFASVPVQASAGHYLLLVLEHRVRREVERVGTKLEQAASSSALDDLRDLARGEVSELARVFGRLAARECAEAEQVSS
jgi:replicative DNA helicase